MLAYLTIAGTSALGYLGAPWWVILCAAAGLVGLSRVELRALGPRFSTVGATYMIEAAMQARMGHSLLAAGLAYCWGMLVRLALAG